MKWEEAGKSMSQHMQGNTGSVTSSVLLGRSRERGKRNAIIIAVVALLVLFGLSSCGSNSTNSKTYAEWPTSGLATQLPQPDSSNIRIITNDEDGIAIGLDDFGGDACEEYVKACIEKGFTLNANTEANLFEAYNADGYYLAIWLAPASQVMDIVLIAPKDSASENSSTSESEDSSTSDSSTDDGTVSPDFKEMMDSYESVMNKYCDFMENYNSSSDPMSMLSDLTAIMAEEAEWVEKIDAVDTSSLSAADSAYYLEVTSRVNERLLSLSL